MKHIRSEFLYHIYMEIKGVDDEITNSILFLFHLSMVLFC